MVFHALAVLPLLWSAGGLPGQAVAPPGIRADALSTVYVRDVTGIETRGKLVRLDERSVVMFVNGQQRVFDLAQVWSVQKRGDSLKNGAIIGSVVGFVVGLLSGGLADCMSNDCSGQWAVFTLTSTAVYGLVGIGIDAIVPGRTTLYQRPIVTSGSTSASRPVLRLALRW